MPRSYDLGAGCSARIDAALATLSAALEARGPAFRPAVHRRERRATPPGRPLNVSGWGQQSSRHRDVAPDLRSTEIFAVGDRATAPPVFDVTPTDDGHDALRDRTREGLVRRRQRRPTA